MTKKQNKTETIDEICIILKHFASKDLRIMQTLLNVLSEPTESSHLYYVRDDELLEKLKHFKDSQTK